MKIKQLDFIGFKSFVDKTTVQFPLGISAVVGPNGCGKSNIVDAIRWCMGEQSVKQLRGKSMEDVIFSGTEKKPPLNMAEVAITLINDNGNTPEEYRDFSEIMVGRRLFRSGETVYLINNQPCRLKDIHNLLMGTGVGAKTYGIIEQGRIVTLVDAGPEELRYFLEEAAGITRYKSRRNEALHKVQRTQMNLARVNDVILEVERQMRSLKRQARKAGRYKTYQQQIEHLEVTLATYHYKALSAEVGETDALLQSLKDQDFQHGAELAKLDAAIEQIKQERAAKHQAISDQKAQSYQLLRAIDKLEADIQYNKKDLERLTTEADQLKVDLQENDEENRQITSECHDLEEQKSALEQDIQTIQDTLKQAQATEGAAKDHLAKLNQSLETYKAQLMNLTSRKAAYENTIENVFKQRANLSKRLDQLTNEKSQTEKEHAARKLELAGTEQAHHTLAEALHALEGAIASYKEQLTEKRQALAKQVQEVQTLEAERQKLRSRCSALKKMDDNFEWFRKGVQVIMREWKIQNAEKSDIYGLIADVIEPEPGCEDAVEAALGETLEYVIVKDQEGGVAAIDFLRTQSAGRASFIPMTAVRPLADTNSAPLPQGPEPLIKNLRIKEGYEDLIQSLLGHVMVAENLSAALHAWQESGFRHVIVTRQGDRVSFQGILTGGSPDNGGSGILAKKKEIKALEAQVSQLETTIGLAANRQKALETETITLERELQRASEAQSQKNQQQIQVEKDLYRLQEKCNHILQHMEILDLEVQQMEGEQIDVEQELSMHQESLTALSEEIQDLEMAIVQENASAKEAVESLEAAHQGVVGHKLELTTLQAQHENCQNTLRRLQDFQRDRLKKLTQLKGELRKRQEDVKATESRLERDRAEFGHQHTALKAIEGALAESEAVYQGIERALEENDQVVCAVRSDQQETLQKIQQLELAQSERRMKQDHLVGRVQETYHRRIDASDQANDMENFSLEDTEKALARCRDALARIGDVNLAAIQEYETLNERYRLLTEQRDDLVGAIDALYRVVRKINRTSLKRFMKTFKAANQKLQVVFSRLFEGGAAKLALMNPRKPLESGLSFLVQPPGKKLTQMSLLSGGEKSLAAIALVFSLFLMKPTGFCIFDEVDAPLDDVNVARFTHLLQEIRAESQVVVVTHNKQTMEMADALFGVTMEEKGISKLVSLQLTAS